ncbi:hypothetical protein GGI25_001049, partial [Coemansia spiralis]
LIDVYFAFFTEPQWRTPMWGTSATREGTLLLLNLAVSAAAMGLLLIIRDLPELGSAITLDDDSVEVSEEQHSSHPSCFPSENIAFRGLTKNLPTRNPSPEIGSSIIGNALFSWINGFFVVSKLRQLELDDIFEPPQRYLPEGSWRRFSPYANTRKSLFWKLVAAFKSDIVVQAILNPLSALFEYAQPFFMQQLLWFISKYSQDPSIGLRYGYFLAFMMLTSNIFATYVEQQYNWLSRTLYIGIRNVLYRLLTHKSLSRRLLSSPQQNKVGTDDDKSDSQEVATNGKIYNVVTADILRISKFLALFELLFVLPVKLVVGAWYMYRLLGFAGVLGTALLLAIVCITQNLVERAKRIELNIGALNDQRLAIISEVVQGISSVKLFGWGSRFIDIIGRKRAEQLSAIQERVKIWAFVNLLTVSSLPLINFAAFFIFSIYSELGAETVFTAISVFKIVQRSVDSFPSIISHVISFRVSLKRIEGFLDQPEIQSAGDRVDIDSNQSSLGFSDAVLAWSGSREGSTLAAPSTSTTASLQTPSLSCEPFMLRNVSIDFPLGKLTLIGGPTGSGKSSMLAALIGEMELLQGKITVPILRMPADSVFSSVHGYGLNDIAYVSQEPWLRNASIRDNILFGELYCQERYEKVLTMCALRPDLSIFAAGDMTEIGERGITLSGGQKQRVALARAVYSKRSMMLIDDCLSAVDAHTGRHILHKCLASSDEVMSSRTRILVTHHMAMCLPHSDFVVMMQGGEITFQGSPESLAATADKLDLSYVLDTSSGANDSVIVNRASPIPANSRSDIDDMEHPTQDELNKQRIISAMSDIHTHGKIIEDEARTKGAVKLDTWKAYFGPCGGWRFMVTGLVYIITFQLLAVYKDYYLAARLDKANNMLQLLATYLAIGLLSAVISAATLLYFYMCGLNSSAVLHNRLLCSIIHATPRFLDTTPIGRIMSRFSKDMQIADEDVIEIFFVFLRSLLSVVITLVAISLTIPPFVIIGILVLAMYVHLTWQFMRVQRESKRLEGIGIAPILSLYSEMIPGCSLIRAFNMEREYMEEMKQKITTFICADFVLRSSRRWVGIRMGLASSLVAFFTALFVIASIGRINSGLAGFILIYSASYWTDAVAFVRRYNDLELSLNCVERAHQYMFIEQEAASKTEVDEQILAEWPCTGALSVKNLVAGYTASQPILHGISFDISHGEKIGVVGRTGAGKSTLSLALLRLIEASSGVIELDGVDVSTLGLEKLRQSITIIPQDPVLFNGTIRFNLDPFGDYSDSILLDALQRTLLLKLETPLQTGGFNHQYNSVAVFSSLDDKIVSNGQNLALGQRQLVALARALVRRSRLVVMDEATASVDFATDESMQQAIRGSEFSDSTLLCIAHRLRTIIDYNCILVLDEGKIVEFDAPENLLQNKDSFFYQLCRNSGELDTLKQALSKSRNKNITL